MNELSQAEVFDRKLDVIVADVITVRVAIGTFDRKIEVASNFCIAEALVSSTRLDVILAVNNVVLLHGKFLQLVPVDFINKLAVLLCKKLPHTCFSTRHLVDDYETEREKESDSQESFRKVCPELFVDAVLPYDVGWRL